MAKSLRERTVDILDLLKSKLSTQSPVISPATVKAATGDRVETDFIKAYGISHADLRKIIDNSTSIQYERSSLYQTVERSLVHPIMSAASVAYAETATTRSPIQGAAIWGVAKNKEYQYQIDKLFDIISIEEVLYDWAWTTAVFGDFLVEAYGEPGVGIVSVSDDAHPIQFGRADYSGRLVGFIQSPSGAGLGSGTQDDRKLLPPWSLVHFRLLGARRRRPLIYDNNYAEYRTISIMSPDPRRLTSKYGTSVLADALPAWKRLRLVEDSVMIARIMKSPERWLFKVVIDEKSSNPEQIVSLLDSYASVLKRSRALDTRTSSSTYSDQFNAMSNAEDLLLPVWGSKDNLEVEQLGGSADIRWIADVEELRNQLVTALRVPYSVLAGYQAEAGSGGFTPGQAMERVDIRFARQARRLQSAIISGITRLVQIHLAYQGLDPDLSLFDIHMAEASSAEEIELQEALQKGVDATGALYDLLDRMIGTDLEKVELLKYFNEKFFKLNDLDLNKILRRGNPNAFTGDQRDLPVPGVETEETGESPEGTEGSEKPEETRNVFREHRGDTSDLKSALPIGKSKELWESNWKDKKIIIAEVKQGETTGGIQA